MDNMQRIETMKFKSAKPLNKASLKINVKKLREEDSIEAAATVDIPAVAQGAVDGGEANTEDLITGAGSAPLHLSNGDPSGSGDSAGGSGSAEAAAV